MARRGVQGTGQATNASANTTIIAAQGAGVPLRLMKGVIMVEVAAVGGGGEVALEDGSGGTRIFQADADAVGVYNFDFSPDGYVLTANTLLNLTVDGAVTTQATATATVTAAVE